MLLKRCLYVIIISRTSFIVNSHSIVCLNVKALLAWSRRHIWRLSDSNEIRTYNKLVRKQTLNYVAKLASLAKWLSVRLRTKQLWVQISLLSLKLQILRLLRARMSLKFRQTVECGVTLKLVRDMIITYSQMHRTDKYSQHSSVIYDQFG